MNSPSLVNQTLVYQSIDWLDRNFDNLAEIYTLEIANIPADCFRFMSFELRYQIATTYLLGLIERLKGDPFPAERLKNMFGGKLIYGLQMYQILEVVDRFLTLLTYKAHETLADEPEVYEVLLSKATCVSQLLKATIAAALVQQSGQKIVPARGA